MSIRHSAIRLLARREHSRRELFLKLTQREFESATIHQIISDLEQDDLLSESRFISMIVRVRSSRGVGPLKIIAELQTHGIHQREIEQDEDWQATDWIQIGRIARAKRFKETKPYSIEESAKQTRHLIQRGFRMDQVIEILKPENIDAFIAMPAKAAI
jgi:regulatory protein